MSAHDHELGSQGIDTAAHGTRIAEARPTLPGALFMACLDDIVDGIAIHSAIRDDTGRIVDFLVEYANQATSRITGLPHDDLVGRRILDLFPGRRLNGVFDAYVQVVESGEPILRESLASEDPPRSDPDGFGRDFDIRVSKLGDGYVVRLRDVTARNRAEDELFKSQEMLRLVLDTIPHRVFWKDTESVFVGCNAAFARNLGLSDPAEIVGKSDYDLESSEAAELYRADDREIIETGLPKVDYEEPHARADGTAGWARTSKVPIRDEHGRVIGLLGTYEDITDQKRAAEALRESESFLATIFENIPDMVFVKDAATLRFVRLNRAGEKMLGRSRDELIGQDDRGMSPPDEEERFWADDRKVAATGQILEIPEEPLTSPKDGRRIIRTTKIPIFGDDGRTRYVLGISQDITARKMAEEASLESEGRYRHIIEAITDYVVSVKIENGEAVSVSHGPGCIAITGYSPEELRAEPDLWGSLVVAEDRELVAESMRRILAGQRISPVEHRLRRKDGAVRWVRHTPVLRFNESGAPVAYDGLIQDITERRVLQDQLLQAQKMEGIGQLAGGVAHDFNNLLTAILGYVEMCKMDLPADLPADHPARQDLLEVAAAGERAANLTKQLLAFASRQMVAPIKLDLSALVNDSLKMIGRLLGDDIEIETAIDPEAGTVLADPGQIQQLLVNLAVNARDAMPNGGRLLIETGSESVDDVTAAARPGAVSGPHVLLTVTDTGEGMTEEVTNHLFEPFFTTKEFGKGTGLGLATCHGIVRQMRGHIQVYSEIGHGTTFHVYLPRKLGGADPTVVVPPTAPTPTGSETVLIVEDEPRVRHLAVLGLRARGYVVLEAANGAEAIRIALRVGGTLDLVVSDVLMPGMSGPELLRELAVIAPHARALLMSGHAEATVLDQAKATHHSFLPKPYTPERLARKVREVLDAPAAN